MCGTSGRAIGVYTLLGQTAIIRATGLLANGRTTGQNRRQNLPQTIHGGSQANNDVALPTPRSCLIGAEIDDGLLAKRRSPA